MSDTRGKLAVEFLYRMVGSGAVGERAQINGPLGGRYMSTAKGGGRIEGPRLKGDLVEGFVWGPHRMRGNDYSHMHYDVRMLLRTDDGSRVLIRYRGTNSPAYPDGSWRIAPVFEAEDGPYAWLNSVQAMGVGRKVGEDIELMVYAVKA